jgi:hypothetical protein
MLAALIQALNWGYSFERSDEKWVNEGSEGRLAADASLKVRCLALSSMHTHATKPKVSMCLIVCAQLTGDYEKYWDKGQSVSKQGCVLLHGAPLFNAAAPLKGIRDRLAQNVAQQNGSSYSASKAFLSVSTEINAADFLRMMQHCIMKGTMAYLMVASFITMSVASIQRSDTIEQLRFV